MINSRKHPNRINIEQYNYLNSHQIMIIRIALTHQNSKTYFMAVLTFCHLILHQFAHPTKNHL